jgi:hypothetical protein
MCTVTNAQFGCHFSHGKIVIGEQSLPCYIFNFFIMKKLAIIFALQQMVGPK